MSTPAPHIPVGVPAADPPPGPFSTQPEIDTSSATITFVEILFALAVGQVLDPLQEWARQSPPGTRITRVELVQLAVAFIITITSWIGYHASTNRPRFKIVFFNVEFFKLLLDVSMVTVYFLLAAFAARPVPTARPETVLVFVAFLLYLAWDMLATLEHRRPRKAAHDRKTKNKYEKAWEDALVRGDIKDPWSGPHWGRVGATGICVGVATVIWVWVWFIAEPLGTHAIVALDVGLVVLLIGYRLLKEYLHRWWGNRDPAAGAPVAAH